MQEVAAYQGVRVNSCEYAVTSKDVDGNEQEIARCRFKCQADMVAIALTMMFPGSGFESKVVARKGGQG